MRKPEFNADRSSFLSKGRGRALWRVAVAPVAVLMGIAVVELLTTYFPGLPDPAPLVLVAVAFAGFVAGPSSALLASAIAVAYALFFVAMRHSPHMDMADCIEALYLAILAPTLSISAGNLRQQVNRTAETLQRHLGNTPLGVIELYDDFEINLWAGAAERIFGYTSKEACGKNLFHLPGIFYSEEDARAARKVLESIGRGDKTQAVHLSRSEYSDGWAGHSRWFWLSTLQSYRKSSRYLVLVEDITQHVRAEEEVEAGKTEIIERLVRAAEYRDEETGMHVVRMSRYCEALGRAAGMPTEEIEMLRKAASMHDIGKIGIPDSILLKAGSLTKEEFEIIKSHTTIGADLLGGSKHPLVQMAEKIALTHHEGWDGNGYPARLKGEKIPLVGRICAVCDMFDALSSSRPYKEAWIVDDVVHELSAQAGTHLDPNLVQTFVNILPEILAIRDEHAQAPGRRLA